MRGNVAAAVFPFGPVDGHASEMLASEVMGEVDALVALDIAVFLIGLAALVLCIALLLIPFMMLSIQKSILRELQIMNMVMRQDEDDDEDREAVAGHDAWAR
jgi:sensor histidine kinase YesM